MEAGGYRQTVYPILDARRLRPEVLHAPLVLIDRLDAHRDPRLRWVEGIETNPDNQDDKVDRLSQVQPAEQWRLLCAPTPSQWPCTWIRGETCF